MDFGEVKVHERQRNAGPCGRFTVQEPEAKAQVKAGSMMAKISLCLGVLLIALVLELGSRGQAPQRQVFAAEAARPEATAREENLGAIYFVEAGSGEGAAPTQGADDRSMNVQRMKWAPPVRADEVTILRDDSVVGFSALNSEVSCCCAGQVFAVGEDEDWGKYVRVRSAGDLDAVYYGLEEVAVRAGQTVTAGQLLGTVPVGRQVYLSVSEKGAPQDPRAYVSLTVQKQA
ncbi:MAG: M23 family metallopeptidase [Clostridia bacterium]|nr:M23 family metallopeptidase [Clostridia bacterium]